MSLTFRRTRTVKLSTSLRSWPYLHCRVVGFTSLGLSTICPGTPLLKILESLEKCGMLATQVDCVL